MLVRHVFLAAALALLSITAGCSRSQRPTGDRELAARLDSLATPEATAERLSGTILIARGDSVILQRTWGFADWERRVPVSPSTRFGIGSIT
jgi:CubicO group peptidase (beta-lactamase class C family)